VAERSSRQQMKRIDISIYVEEKTIEVRGEGEGEVSGLTAHAQSRE